MSTSSLHAGSNAASAAPRADHADYASSSFVSILVRASDTVLGWIERDRDRRALGRLDDRLLRDIGITRAELDAEATKPFWRG